MLNNTTMQNLKEFLQSHDCDLGDFVEPTINEFKAIRCVSDKRGKRSKSFKVVSNTDGSIVVILKNFKTDTTESAKINLDHDQHLKTITENHYKKMADKKKDIEKINLFFKTKLLADKDCKKTNKYLDNKKVKTSSFIKWDKKNNLYIPLINIKRELVSYQKITNNGFKILAKGGTKKGSFFTIGNDFKTSNALVFVEGYATARSIHEATGLPCIMCVDAGNLYSVVEAFRKKYPSKLFIIAADNDIDTERNSKIGYNVGVKKAEDCKNICGDIKIAIPSLIGDESTDWNDHLCAGADGIKYIKEEFNKITPLITS